MIAEVVVRPKSTVGKASIQLSRFNSTKQRKQIKGRTQVKTRHEKKVVGKLFSHVGLAICRAKSWVTFFLLTNL